MEKIFTTQNWLYYGVPIVRLLFAAICGALIGYEREKQKKAAGLRTHALVCIGACLFSLVGLKLHSAVPHSDILRLLQGLLIGTGFIAGGVIFREGSTITGLTTATGLWVLAAVGMAVGIGEYYLAIVATILIFFILNVIAKLEDKMNNED